ncbi:hypothetical protein SLE2022_047590 [Rubroshorea leprosula]
MRNRIRIPEATPPRFNRTIDCFLCSERQWLWVCPLKSHTDSPFLRLSSSGALNESCVRAGLGSYGLEKKERSGNGEDRRVWTMSDSLVIRG